MPRDVHADSFQVFCNSRKAVDESTADLTIFLALGILRDYSRLHVSMRQGRWRGGLAPVRDPAGLTLGLVGCGAIGKVSLCWKQGRILEAVNRMLKDRGSMSLAKLARST